MIFLLETVGYVIVPINRPAENRELLGFRSHPKPVDVPESLCRHIQKSGLAMITEIKQKLPQGGS